MLAATPQQQLFRRRGCITPGKESVKKISKSMSFLAPSFHETLDFGMSGFDTSAKHIKNIQSLVTMSSSDFPQKPNHGRAFLRGY